VLYTIGRTLYILIAYVAYYPKFFLERKRVELVCTQINIRVHKQKLLRTKTITYLDTWNDGIEETNDMEWR
jgi:hypothetical protein